jgi:hypothetical protein
MTLTAAGARMPTTTNAMASGASMITASCSTASARSFFTLASAGGFDGLVGVGEGLLGGVENGLHLVQLLPDTPQRPAFAVHGPAGDQVLGDGAEAEESVEFFGNGEVLAVEDLNVGQVQQILRDRDGLRADVTGGQRVGGLVADRDLNVARCCGTAAGRRRSF